MADFEKVRTGHGHWTVQWPASPCARWPTSARASRARVWWRGLYHLMLDRLTCFCAPQSSLVAPLPGRPLAG